MKLFVVVRCLYYTLPQWGAVVYGLYSFAQKLRLREVVVGHTLKSTTEIFLKCGDKKEISRLI